MKKKVLRPDGKGRITLGVIAKNVSGYEMEQKKDGSIVLSPRVEVPAKEVWLFENMKAKSSVARGLKDVAQGKTVKLGSFAKYKDDDLDE